MTAPGARTNPSGGGVRRVLMVHNWHREATISGENRVVEADTALLRSAGIEVENYARSNDEIDGFGLARWTEMTVRPIVSVGDARALRRHISRFKPDIVHIHNVVPLLSPWVVRTAKAEGIPVVQTVHNYLHTCMAASFFRDGHPCHDCQGRTVPWPGVVHGCSPTARMRNPVGARMMSTTLGLSIMIHRPTWRLVDRFIAVGEVVARHLEVSGIDPRRVTVRANPVTDPGAPSPPPNGGALYAGRLAQEKGVRALLSAWERSGLGTRHRLRLAGGGPDHLHVESLARAMAGVELLGTVSHERVLELMNESGFIVAPSLWEEPFGLTVVEAMARGRPALVTNLGEPSRVVDERCGWVVEPVPDAIAAGLVAAFESPLEQLGAAARQRYEERYSPPVALRNLMAIYEDVVRASGSPQT
jgi:glycosyltransferase involved in cell wall biosynthesis